MMREMRFFTGMVLSSVLLAPVACGSDAGSDSSSSGDAEGSTSSTEGSGGTTETSSSGGETGTTTGDGDGDDRVPGEDETVVVFDQEHFYFGEENRRNNRATVTFPPAEYTYSEIIGHFRLSCPNGRCDHWDRYGTFGMIMDEGLETENYVELDRFITAYRVGFSWDADLTYLRPLLTGERTMEGFIDTWVGPGHEQGDGWLLEASIEFVGGPPPSPEAKAVIPLWGHGSYKSGVAENPVEDQITPQTVELPEANYYLLRAFITGHGFGGVDNCAEFCAKDHTFSVDQESFTRTVWRSGCGSTVTDGPQQGTWQYDRAGWCPGAQVYPWDTDASAAFAGGGSHTVRYRLEPWAWNGDGGEPYYYHSAMVVALD